MELIPICRVCLIDDVHYLIENTQLQNVYEKLTSTPLQTDNMKPRSVCSICYAKLHATYKLMLRCLKADNILTQLFNSDNKVKLQEKIEKLTPFSYNLCMTPVEQNNIESDKEDDIVKQEVKFEQDETQDVYESGESEVKEASIVSVVDEPEVIHSSEEADSADISTYIRAIGAKKFIQNNDKPSVPVVNADTNTDENNDSDIEYINTIALLDNAVSRNNTQQESTINETHWNTTSYLEGHDKTGFSDSRQMFNNSCVCNICQQQFVCQYDLITHSRIHLNDKLYSCTMCPESFNSQSCLGNHMRMHSVEGSYICNVCYKSCVDEDSFKTHILTHDRPYTCNICNKVFSSDSSLTRHNKLHSEKPYTCNICKKCFSNKDDLGTHAKFHTSGKPYICKYCQKSFNSKRHLSRHHISHTGESPYYCNVCKRSFKDKSYFLTHTRMHTGQYAYTCDICQKKYYRKPPFKAHMKTHT